MKKRYFVAFIAVVLCLLCAFTGCSKGNYLVDVTFRDTENGTEATYLYSDGSTKTSTVKNGRDGQDGKDVSAQSVYEQWLEKNGLEDSTENYNRFLSTLGLDLATDNSATVQSTLNSVATLYCEYVYSETVSTGPWWSSSSQKQYALAMSIGSSFIYRIDESQDGYTYLVTNAHVVYCNKADYTANGNSYFPKAIHAFLYGSFNYNAAYGASGETDPTYKYKLVEYSSYAVECELVGACVSADLAVVRAKTSALKSVNPDIEEVAVADTYYVGQTVYTVGNTGAQGFTATQGIISVDNEDITLAIDNTKRTYRSLRFDGFIYEGNSGGALFNTRGQLVGVVNAGDSDFNNMNYAIPLEIFDAVVPNLIDHFDGTAISSAQKPMLGVTVLSENARYIYDSDAGYGKIHEDVTVNEITADSIAARMGIQTKDRIVSMTIDGKRHDVLRSFAISDCLYHVREGSTLKVELVRGTQTLTLETTVSAADLQKVV